MKTPFFAALFALLLFCVGTAHAQTPASDHAQIAQATAKTPAAKPAAKAGSTAPATAATAPKGPRVAIETNKGTIVVELDPVKAPITVKNFLAYVKSGFYSGTVFHRIISSFMIQGGGFTADYRRKETRDPIKLEAGNGLSNVRGTIAMARTGVRDSATSQFFINVVDNLRLDNYGGGYAVFGKVVKGIEAVDAIRYVPTRPHSGQPNAPVEPVIIKKVTLLP
mgnify:CR=1 FL=1